jgi:hypothetical protein
LTDDGVCRIGTLCAVDAQSSPFLWDVESCGIIPASPCGISTISVCPFITNLPSVNHGPWRQDFLKAHGQLNTCYHYIDFDCILEQAVQMDDTVWLASLLLNSNTKGLVIFGVR